MPFAALDGRVARSWKQLTTEMLFNGKIASPGHNAGTLVAIVTKQLEKTRTIHCGKGDIHILGWPKDGDATLLKLMRCMQRVTSAAHKLVDAVIDPHIFGNSVECFDVVQWIDVLKAQRMAAARSTASETTDRLLGLYRKYCAGRGWEPAINSFRDLMLEAASAYIDQEVELERHGNKLGLSGAPPWAHTEDAMSRHAIKMAYYQLIHRGVNVQSRKKEIAGAFCYTRSTCDDERELWALSHRYKSSGQDRCHPEYLRDSVVVQRYGPTSKDAIVGTGNVLTDDCKTLT